MKNIIKLMPMRENEQRTRINHIRRGGRAAAGNPGALTIMGITKRTYDEYHSTDVDEEGCDSSRQLMWSRSTKKTIG